IDGADITSVLLVKRPTTQPVHEFIYYYGDANLNAIRSGPWKLKLVTNLQQETEYGKYDLPEAKIPLALYNLEEDPSEQKSVDKDHPDVVERLRKYAHAIRQELGDRRLNVIGKGIRPIGEVPYSRRPSTTGTAK